MYKVRGRDSYEAGMLDERNRRNQLRLDGWEDAEAEDEYDAFLRSLSDEETERLAVTGELTQSGMDNAEPRDLGQFTSRRHAITGAFRAITDNYIREMAQQEEDYRRGIAG
jgi:hypothetical protein